MRVFALALAVGVLLAGCAPGQTAPRRPVKIPPLQEEDAEEARATNDYTQKIRKEQLPPETPETLRRALKRRIAVARFGDLKDPFASPAYQVTLSVKADEVNAKVELATQPTDLEPCPGFTGLLIQALIDSGRFIVVERKEINKILGEQDFGASGRVLPRTAAELGKVRGVQLVLTGEVAAVGAGDAPRKIMAMLRIYDVQTAQILASAKVQADSPSAAVKQAAKKVIEALEDKSWTTKVSKVRGDIVFLNAGEAEGIHKGDRFRIIALGEPILDPDEATVLGREEEEAGIVEVTTVEERYCEAKRLKQDREFQVGDRAEFIAGPYPQHDW